MAVPMSVLLKADIVEDVLDFVSYQSYQIEPPTSPRMFSQHYDCEGARC